MTVGEWFGLYGLDYVGFIWVDIVSLSRVSLSCNGSNLVVCLDHN